MLAPGIVETIYVFKQGHFRLSPCLPHPPPDRISFEGFENGLNNRIIIAISLAVHGYQKAMRFEPFPIIMRAILTATISIMGVTFGWLAQGYRYVERPDRQIALHAVANGPANHTTRMQIQDDGQIQPPFAGPYVADVAGSFMIACDCREVSDQQVGSDGKAVVAVGRNLNSLARTA